MLLNQIVCSVSESITKNEKQISKFIKELENLPQGHLIIKSIRGKKRYYHNQSNTGANGKTIHKYISQSNEKMLAALLRKKFIEASIRILKNNIKVEKYFANKYIFYDPDAIMADVMKNYKGAKSNILCDYNKDKKVGWATEPYIKNNNYTDNLNHYTIGGLKVRSKSESIIAGLLESYEIPFRYEQQLILDGNTFYPDFTILKPEENTVIYWEHFGLADKKNYKLSMLQKIDTYISNGIVPGINLIMTIETEKITIDPRRIATLIKTYIL